jgi:drug/metabolite transporter (DMT)-like permease
MSRTSAVAILLLAAVLEVGGDAIVRSGLHRQSIVSRALLFALGAGVLFAYGVVVNSPAWNFGKLLGLYVVFVFVTAQVISWLAFSQPPTRAVLLGGLLIVAGGFVIALNQS